MELGGSGVGWEVGDAVWVNTPMIVGQRACFLRYFRLLYRAAPSHGCHPGAWPSSTAQTQKLWMKWEPARSVHKSSLSHRLSPSLPCIIYRASFIRDGAHELCLQLRADEGLDAISKLDPGIITGPLTDVRALLEWGSC